MDLLHEMLEATAAARPDARSITDRSRTLSYAQLAEAVQATACGLIEHGLCRGDRVAVWLPKRNEKVIALLACLRAGGIAVPVNYQLKAPQAGHILNDAGARILVTTAARCAELTRELPSLETLRVVVTVDEPASWAPAGAAMTTWGQLIDAPASPMHRIIDADVAALFYTSGSTGRSKGVILSHRNLVAGARSVSSYLGNTPDDRLLALLSFSFDYGFSQLSTAFTVGASVVLLDYALPQEVLRTLERERITGLAAVPPIWIQLGNLTWPEGVRHTLRYITNSGGAMPQPTLAKLRQKLPKTRVFLMYGLTEAFRSTYLPPEEVDRRPDSIGKAIPGAEILVLRPDGSPCDSEEPGELVHRGALVSRGYWKDPERTAERFRPVPSALDGLPLTELAVWSGDIVRQDCDGFLYFIGRRDEMIKTSGTRVSPTEVEEEAYATGLVSDAVAVGVPHAELGQAIVLVATPPDGHSGDTGKLIGALKRRLPRYMVPLAVDWHAALPRTGTGKFDRSLLRRDAVSRFEASLSRRADGEQATSDGADGSPIDGPSEKASGTVPAI